MNLESVSKENKSAGVSFSVAPEENQLLNRSARENIRAKKNEAKLRLEDHLRRFPQADWQQHS
ncbi:TraY domain-containing protein [Vibrio aerogenes]|uniref:TraY domain-containing protein n=1 Tax=Vibrio aerogenes TaxID=92172 RepID=UPI0021C460EE|nr:TraY domain-containing protein [Vibrio aerogenes]